MEKINVKTRAMEEEMTKLDVKTRPIARIEKKATRVRTSTGYLV
jgi:hypothetical protein